MLKDHGVRRSGKMDCTPLVQAKGLCGPDQHAMQAKMRMNKRYSATLNAGNVVPTEPWDLQMKDWRDVERIEKRKNRGGANFSPGDAC